MTDKEYQDEKRDEASRDIHGALWERANQIQDGGFAPLRQQTNKEGRLVSFWRGLLLPSEKTNIII